MQQLNLYIRILLDCKNVNGFINHTRSYDLYNKIVMRDHDIDDPRQSVVVMYDR